MRILSLKDLKFVSDDSSDYLSRLEIAYNQLTEENKQLKEKVKLQGEVIKNNSGYSMNEKIKELEDVIGAIANIDGAFITPEGDCYYTDKQALEKIAEWVDPIWSDIAKRERRL